MGLVGKHARGEMLKRRYDGFLMPWQHSSKKGPRFETSSEWQLDISTAIATKLTLMATFVQSDAECRLRGGCDGLQAALQHGWQWDLALISTMIGSWTSTQL